MSTNDKNDENITDNIEKTLIENNLENKDKVDELEKQLETTNIRSNMIESKFGLNFNYSIHSTAKNTRMTYESSMKNTLNQNELINYENENLKFKIIELEEALEKEKSRYQEKILSDNSNISEVERYLRMEINNLQSNNKTLENKLYLANLEIESTISKFEKQIEENMKDFDKLANENHQYMRKYYDIKIELNKLNEENILLKEQLGNLQFEQKEKIKLIRKNSELKEEIFRIKSDFKFKIDFFKSDLEEMKFNFLNENNTLQRKIILLNEVIITLEKEKNQLEKDFEERTDKFKFELLSIKEKQSGNSLKNPIISYSPIKTNLIKSTKDFLNYNPDHSKNDKGYYDKEILENENRTVSPNRLSDKPKNSSNNINSPDYLNRNTSINSNTFKKLTQINDLIFSLEKNIPDLKKNYQGLLIKINKNEGNSLKFEKEINNIEESINNKIDEFNKLENYLMS